jgi:restriction system protein
LNRAFAVQAFVGALKGQKARKGIFITTSTFTRDAVGYAKGLEDPVVLIDGTQLAELMIAHDIGVTTVKTYPMKRVDTDYFTE